MDDPIENKVVDYETPPPVPEGSAAVGIAGIIIYAIGLGLCWFLFPSNIVPAMEMWSLVYFGGLGVYFGSKYGTQKKDYWF